ncbi:MAG: hypothetical protein R3A79_17530 [Nannocystaceae bacterium]
MTFPRVWSIAAFSLLVACGGAKSDAGKADADKAKAAGADAEPEEGGGDAAKEADAAAATKKQFDRSRDKSGVLARTAAVLEAEEDFDNEKLRGLSHHAEKLPSVKAVCKHVTEVRKTPDALEGCVKDTEHWLAKIGPEIYEDLAQCLLEAKTVDDLAQCEEAEHDIEVVLHGDTRGDGLDKETCDKFYDHFEKLTMAEAGDQSKLVEDILEEVRADMIVTCMEQGTKAEIECAMKTEDVDKLEDCSPKLL